MQDNKLEKYCLEIISAVSSGKARNAQQLNSLKNRLCEKHAVSFAPSNAKILSFAVKKTQRLLKVLEMKPVKSISGIVAVALMPRPQKCPGKCIYCPSSLVGEETPKSYTGREPATLRALQAGYDARKQIQGRIRQLEEMGHSAEKIELIVMGGTFPAAPEGFQEKFMLDCINAASWKSAKSIESAKKLAEKARHRIVGITFETRPDYCGTKEIERMLCYGATRVEIGVQSLDSKVLEKIGRNHSVNDIAKATMLSKDSALKVAYHLMPGLPYSSPGKDLKTFRTAFNDERFRPDMLKIYPCLVLKGTKLHRLWKKGEFKPLDNEKAAELIVKAKQLLPEWVRIMRIQRDIPTQLIEAGVKNSNLRQLVHEKLREKGLKCRCIRCREIGLQEYLHGKKPNAGKLEIKGTEYKASNGIERFLAMEDSEKNLYGFLRLRKPFRPFVKELEDSSLVRELHVYGTSLPIGKRARGSQQHSGIGKALLQEAERVSKSEWGFGKQSIISGIGVREYYRKLGYKDDGFFESRIL